MKDAPLKLINFFGGGGGGSAPTAPTLRQVGTGLTDPLYTQSAAIGDQWAQMMRQDYGFAPGGPAWRAPLGKGVLAMQGQAALPFAGKQDPQTQAVLKSAFGAPTAPGGGGTFGGAGAGSTWNLGSNPYQMGRELGQQFKNPLQQLERNQQFATTLLQQWKPPDLRLTGEDLLNVKMGQMAQNAQAQQAAFAAALQGSSAASSAQSQAQAAELAALGKVGSSFFQQSPSLTAGGYQTSPFGLFFGGGGGGGGMDFSGFSGSAGGMDVPPNLSSGGSF